MQWDTVIYGGLSPDTLYVIKAIAYNGDTISTPGISEASHAKSQPDKPSGLTITATYRLLLNWNSVLDKKCSYYIIQKDTAAGASDSIAGVPSGTTSFLDTNVVLGKIYFYRVTAVDSFGAKSEPSDEASMYPAITFSMDTVSGRCIDSVVVPVYLDKNVTKDSIYSFELYISYDPKVLEPGNWDTTHTLAGQMSNISMTDTNGVIRIAGFDPYPLVSDTNLLIKLKFKIEISQASTDYTKLDMQEVILNDDYPPAFMKDGLVQVDSIKMGDVSLNYDVTAYDCALILEHIVKISTLGTLQQWVADVSGSGSVNAYDGTLILQKVLGIISAFPDVDSLLTLKSAGVVDNVKIKIEPYYSEDGNFIIVPIELQNSSNVKSIQFEMRYPSEKVEYNGFSAGPPARDFTTLHNVPVNGTLLVAMASARPLQGEGRVVEIRFKVKEKTSQMPEFRLMKFMANETVLQSDNVTGIENREGIPTTYDLGQNYPNPFNPSTIIRFQIPKLEDVKITVYNILGQRIITLIEKELPAGYYQVQWNGVNQHGLPIASGIYLYHMQAGTYVTTRKMLFRK